ncbi:hypothetical protein RN001_012486 [Aquatica leii]|uniref:Selenoprotein F/M domain-containing protein n=1 Tax=Aquatica leii TaxID=1421715 RepID=A0AAN7PSX9_9COLE|nr:hypothetical protein RN001_012486 [Aquatica leii]
MLNMHSVIFLCGLLLLGNCEKINNIVRAKIETCAGCQLYDLPDLKAFIFEDFTQYEDTELKLVPGAAPILIFLDKSDEPVERVDLKLFGRNEPAARDLPDILIEPQPGCSGIANVVVPPQLTPKKNIVTPEAIRPHLKASARKTIKRRKVTSTVLTDTPEIEERKQKEIEKK